VRYEQRYQFRDDFSGWSVARLQNRINWDQHRLRELACCLGGSDTGLVWYLIDGYRTQLRRLRRELEAASRGNNVSQKRNQPLRPTTGAKGETIIRLAKKAPVWFVIVRAAKKSFPKVFAFVAKDGVPAMDRARAYAKKLAERNHAHRVYVTRPRAKYGFVGARSAGLNVTEY
jgi:hypothetical protein